MNLPAELLEHILVYLSKGDLKRIRFVSKNLAEIAVPFLFNSVFLSRDVSDLEKAERFLASFITTVTTAVVCPLKYANLSRRRYEKLVACRSKPFDKLDCFDDHIEAGYRQYSIANQRTAQASLRTRMEELLRQVVREGPKFRKLVVTHRSSYRVMSDKEVKSYCCRDPCPIPLPSHNLFRLTPLQSMISANDSNIGRPLLSVLGESNLRIKEFIMDPCRARVGFFKLPIDTFVQSPATLKQMSHFLGSLTKLRLDLDEQFQGKPHLFSTGIVTRQLRHAQNLQCLFLDLRSPGYLETTFCDTLEGCEFSKLRVLILCRYTLEGDELVTFLKHSPRLKHFVLQSCWLEGYFWKDLIEDIKVNTKLESIHLNALYEGFEAASGMEQTDWYVDSNDDVENYVLHDGPNPFSIGFLSKYPKDWWRQKGNTGPDWAQEYYGRYF